MLRRDADETLATNGMAPTRKTDQVALTQYAA